MKAVRKAAVYFLGIIIWFAVWYIASKAVNQSIILPRPSEVLLRLAELAKTSAFLKSVLMSMLRVSCGIVIALVLGVLFASLSAGFKFFYEFLRPTVAVIKATPVVSFIFVAYILFQSKYDLLTAVIAALIVFPVIYESIYAALHGVSRELVEVADVCGSTRGERLRYLWIPTALPAFVTAGKTTIGLAWKAGIAAEALIAIPNMTGIGSEIADAKRMIETVDQFAWTLVIILLSLAIELVFSAISKKLVDKIL